MRQSRIVANEQVCIGCHLCEIHCLAEHSRYARTDAGRPSLIVKAYKREQPRAQARVHVEEDLPTTVAVQCHHCTEPMCVYSCLTGAMQKDPVTGIVTSDPDRCMGCWTCIMVCPFGALQRDVEHRSVVKCDFCAHRANPACVDHCPNEALTLVEVER